MPCALLAIAAAFLSTGCGLISSDIDPEFVEVRVEGPAGTQVQVITSNSFTFGSGSDDGGVEVQLFSADTATVPLAHVFTEPLAPSYLYYVRVLPVTPDATPFDVRVQLRVDGDVRYDKSGQLGSDQFEYAYVYR